MHPTHSTDSHAPYLDTLLARQLTDFLGSADAATVALLRRHLHWVELDGGQTLMAQGEPGDALYLLVSGRLRAYLTDADGNTRAVREIPRGQVVGEMSLLTDAPRSATLVAVRDSVLAKMDKADFKQLLELSGHVSMALTRQIIHRVTTENLRSAFDRPATVGLLAVSASVDLTTFARFMAEALARHGRVAVVDAARIDADLGLAGIARVPDAQAEMARRIALRLDEIEADHDFVLLVGDSTATAWTRRCCRQSDEIYLLADADQPPVLHAIETDCLMHRAPRSDAAEILVLLHPADRHAPRDTAAWLSRRPLAGHLHLRAALERDRARLARMVARTAVGLVLAGGGARGLAHLGVWRALAERGVEIDVVGGTSIGAVMAAGVATDLPVQDVTRSLKLAFATNPTGDFNWLPLLSLLKGLRLRRVVRRALEETIGDAAVGIEDLWKPYYCVATNYSRACEHVFRTGPLADAMLASIAIPGALPPVIVDGELLCDGGTFNNFPVDVMRGMRGVGRVVGVDLGLPDVQRIAHADVPGSWTLLRDRLRPLAARRYTLPSLAAYLMNVTVLFSDSRQRQNRGLTDLYFSPPVARVGMLEWRRFDEIVERGYRHACEVMDRAPGPDPAS